MGLTSSPEDTVKEWLKIRKNAHVMLVDGMSKLTTHDFTTCQSSVFHIFGLKWKLVVCPHEDDGTKLSFRRLYPYEGRWGYLSIYVGIEDTKSLPFNWEVKCSLKLMVIDQKAAQTCHSTEWPWVCFSAKKETIGKADFMPYTMFKDGYLVNDKAFFSAEISNVRANFTLFHLPRTMGTSERLKLSDFPRNKCRFTWKITQFSSFDDDCHYSYEFTAGPRRWKIVMYPKGNEDGKGNWLSLYLEVTDYLSNGPKADTLADYKLRILDQLHRNHYERELICWFPHDPVAPSSHRIMGLAKYVSFNELKDSSRGFLVNDQMYIGVEFLVLSTTEYL